MSIKNVVSHLPEGKSPITVLLYSATKSISVGSVSGLTPYFVRIQIICLSTRSFASVAQVVSLEDGHLMPR